MKSLTILSLAAVTAMAAPAITPTCAPTPQPTTFSGIAIHSGSDIQYLPVNANGQSLWLGKDTTTYCPSSVGAACPNTTTPQTVFASSGGNSGTVSLDTTVPGGQQVYVSGTGLLKFTGAHSASMDDGAVVDGFGIEGGHLEFQGQDWYACPDAEDQSAWAVYAASLYDAGDDCLGFAFRTVDAGDAQPVWQYE